VAVSLFCFRVQIFESVRCNFVDLLACELSVIMEAEVNVVTGLTLPVAVRVVNVSLDKAETKPKLRQR
jgi:hypothetical protein